MTKHAIVLSLSALLLASGPMARAQDAKTDAKAKKPASIYDVNLDARDQVKAAGKIARRDNQRLLVMFGGDWCGWCHKLHGVFKQNAEIRKVLSEDYKLVMVDTKAPHAEELLDECKGDLKQVGYPFLAVLDADGKVLTRQETDALEEGDHHNPAKVLEFLKKWSPESQDAEQVYSAAIKKAASEDKRVLLHFGAPWCGWCHKLDDFLARADIAPVIGKDFIDLKIDVDRMKGGKDLEAKLRKDPKGGIPFIVLLDSKGEAIINSDGPKGNTGYPAAPEEIAHFMVMLDKACRNLSKGDKELIEKALKDAPEAKRAASGQ